MELLVRKVQNQIRKNLELTGFDSDKKLIIAVSGGSDSSTLLDALVALSPKQRLTLHAAHLNHGIRKESADIATQMQNTFLRYNITFTISQVDVPNFQKSSKLSSEEAARYLRYQFLIGVYEAEQADAIAIAHTLDDQAETVLLHLLRGSGLTGLGGIRMTSRGQIYPDLGSATFVRPLLTTTKKDTNLYCQIQGLNPEHDYTNDSTIYLRNRIRNILLPELSHYNPAIKNSLTQLAQMSIETLDLLDTLVQTSWSTVVEETTEGSALIRDEFKNLHPALRSHLLRAYLNKERGSLNNIDYRHLQQILQLMKGPTGKYTFLPDGHIFKVDRVYGRFTDKV